MPLETATYISQLVSSNPAGTDSESQGDDHLRLIKGCILATFPNFTAVALNSTQAQLDAAATATANSAYTFAVGTAAAPKLNVLGDLTTGFYQSAVGHLSVTTSGIERVDISSAGLNITSGTLQIGGTAAFPVSSANIAAGAVGSTQLASAAVTSAKVATSAITYSLIQNVTNARLLGNNSGAAAAPEEISVGTGLLLSGTTLSCTVSAGSIFAPNVQTFLTGSSATYTTPTNGGNLPLYLRVRMVGGGGGGSAESANAGNAGGATSFASWTANAGAGGAIGSNGGGLGGAGGTGGTNSTGTLITRVSGSAGGGGASLGSGMQVAGGIGGNSPFGGAGSSGDDLAGTNAASNSGSGGGGAGGPGSGAAGAGGGAGEFAEFIITSPASTYTYTVGSGGNGGAAGTVAGGNGGAGRIEVIAYWQ